MKKEIRKVDSERGIVQITTPDERFYTARPIKEIDELKSLSPQDFYPSVTWIASYYPRGYGYEKWLAEKGIDKAEEIRNEAGQKGSRVHKASADLMTGVEVKMDSKYADNNGEEKELTAEEYGIVMTFKRFLDEEQPMILGIEYTVLNHEYKFGGTVDIKCRIKSDGYKFVHIIDIKTSKDIYPSHEIQVSAYKKTDAQCEKIDILQVGYRRNKVGYKLTPIDDQFPVFLAARTIWEKEQGSVVVPQREYPLSLQWKRIEEQEIAIPEKKKVVRKKRIIKKKKLT